MGVELLQCSVIGPFVVSTLTVGFPRVYRGLGRLETDDRSSTIVVFGHSLPDRVPTGESGRREGRTKTLYGVLIENSSVW